MQNLLNILTELLKDDGSLVIDGKLAKNKIVERALALDEKLIKLLLKNDAIKKHFFRDIDGILVFDKVEFQRFVSNKQFLPDSYTAFKNKIGLTANGEYLTEAKEVVLAWPYKDCILEGGQTKEDEKRKEIFWNETLAPDEIDRLLSSKVLTNVKRYDKGGAHQATDISLNDNLIIKGNNLLSLHTIKKAYAGKVKLIYIDPPFNTGNDEFGYNDNFNHSTWLTFVKNRLNIARTLLKDDGVIFIQCDDIEQAHLKILCDEIFNRDNFINIISYERSGSAGIGQGGIFVDTTEFILIYAKNKRLLAFNEVLKSTLIDYEVMKRYNKILSSEGEKILIKEFESKSNKKPVKIFKHKNYEIKSISLKNFDKRENEIRKIYLESFINVFRTTNPQAENSFQQELISNMDEGLYSVEYTPSRGKHADKLTTTYYNNKEIFAWLKDSAQIEDNTVVKNNKLSTVWLHGEIPKADLANEGGVKLKRGKKPEQLLKRIIGLTTDKGDLVLDFHLGSGTTAAVAHKMSRKYIGLEQLDYGENDSVIRLQNVIGGDQTGISKSVNWQGGGSFIYCELNKANAEYSDKIEVAKSSEELMDIWEKIQEKGFVSYKVEAQKINKNKSDFEELSLDEQKQFLVEVLDKNQLYVNYSEIDDKDFNVSDEDKKLNHQFYSLK